MPQTYIHTFKPGLTVRITIDAAQLANGGDMAAFNFKWSRPPSRAEHDEIMPAYLEWKAGIMQRLSDDAGLRILDLVQIGPNDWLPRAFAPAPVETRKDGDE